jgi:predicted DNA-binding transcriptional regulator YafY
MKINRIISIIMQLLQREKVSSTELAKIFGVAVNTVYRDIETIRKAGIPVIGSTTPDGGMAIPEDFKAEKKISSYPDVSAAALAIIEEYPGLLNIESYVMSKHKRQLLEQRNKKTPEKSAAIKVTLRFAREYKVDLSRRYDMDIVSPGDDGRCEAHIYIEPNENEYRRLLSLGDMCECVEPRHVREYIMNKNKAITKTYFSESPPTASNPPTSRPKSHV